MNNPIRDRLLRQLQNRHIGVFQFGTDIEGSPTISGVGSDVATSTRAALDYVTKMGITRIDTFKHGTPWYDMPHHGVSSYAWLSDIANNLPGITLERVAFNMAAAKNQLEAGQTLTELFEQTYGDKIMLNLDGEKASGLRMKNAQGEYLNLQEIQENLAKTWNINIRTDPAGMGKVAKRMKAMMSIQNMETVFDRGLTVGVFDPLKKHAGLMSSFSALDSTDGLSHFNPWTLESMADKYRSQAEELRSVFGGGSSNEAYSQLKRAQGFDEIARRMQETVDFGGRFNIRAFGLNLEEFGVGVGDELASILGEMGGLLKGDTIGVTKEQWLANKWSKDVDIVTSIHGVTQQMRSLGRSVKGHISFRAVHASDTIRTDMQSLSAHRALFENTEELMEETRRRINESLESLRTTGRVSPDFEAHLRRTVAGVQGAENVTGLRTDITFANQILKYMDMGEDITTNQSMVEGIHSSIKKWLQVDPKATKKKGPFIPGAIDAHILGFYEAEEALGELDILNPGQITFNERLGSWIMNNEDIGRFKATFGGWDLDDAMRALLRWDEDTQTLRAPAYRPPTAGMEIGFFHIGDGDMSVMDFLLRDRGLTDEEILMGDFKDLARRFFPKMGDTAALERHSLVNDNIPVWLKYQVGVEDALARNKEAEDAAMKLYASAMEDRPGFTREIMYGQLKAQEPNIPNITLGRYSNVRGAFDSFAEANDLYNQQSRAAGVLNLIEHHERVIDSNILHMGNAEGLLTADQIAEQMEFNLGRMMGLSKELATTDDDYILGIDPEDVSKLIKDVTNLEAGIKSVNPDWDHTMFLFDPEDPRALKSRITREFDELLEDFSHEAREIADSTRAPAWVENTYFDLAAKSDADFLMQTYKLSEERYSRTAMAIAAEIADNEIFDELLQDEDAINTVITDMKRAEMLRAVTSLFEDDGTMGPRAMEAVGAFMQKHVYDNKRGRHVFQEGPLRDIEAKAKAHFFLRDLSDADKDLLDPKQLAVREAVASEEITKDSLLVKYADLIDSDLGLDDVIPEQVETARITKEAEIAAEAAEALARKPWERITLRGLKNAWDESHHFVKKGALGLLGLTAFSFGYQALKDRSPEDLSGPPLLPGGSAYEDYPISPLPMGGEMFGTPMGSGITYQIKATGNFDHNQFRLQAEAIAGSPASASIYRRGRSLAGESTIFDRIKQNFGQ